MPENRVALIILLGYNNLYERGYYTPPAELARQDAWASR